VRAAPIDENSPPTAGSSTPAACKWLILRQASMALQLRMLALVGELYALEPGRKVSRTA